MSPAGISAAALRARPIDVGSFLAAGAGTALLASDQGGFFDRTWPWAAIGFAAVGALALVTVEDLRARLGPLLVPAGLAALSAWTLLSWAWSAEPSTSLHEAVRTPVYVAAALAFGVLAAAGGSAAILAGVAAGTTGIAAYSLADRYLTGVHPEDQQQALLERPLGYANALGALCAIGLVLVLTLAVAARRKPGPLAAALAAAAILVTALVRTESHGAWVAAAAGGTVAAAALAPTRRWAIAAAGVVGLALAALLAVTAFGAPERLQARGDYWHVAWRVAGDHPLAGTGAGTYDLAWAAYGDLGRWGGAVDAHTLYLELLAELGVVGLLLVGSLLAPVVSALRHGQSSPAGAAALGGAAVFLVHAGLDWDWEMPAVTVAGIACLASTLASGDRPLELGPRLRFTHLVLALATLFGYLVIVGARTL